MSKDAQEKEEGLHLLSFLVDEGQALNEAEKAAQNAIKDEKNSDMKKNIQYLLETIEAAKKKAAPATR
jgi:hypothetical protein